jgi:hypothetical protein
MTPLHLFQTRPALCGLFSATGAARNNPRKD